MSLEKRRDIKNGENKQVLEESPFRQKDFELLERKKRQKELEYEEATSIEELPEIEKEVLEIAQDILKLKRYDAEFEVESKNKLQKYPIIEKLYAKCIAKLSYNKGYSKEEIFLAIRQLEEKNWIVTNERRTKLEILENEKLNEILEFIRENPGIHARDEKIEKAVGITRTPFLKHIMTLERFDLIRSKKIGKTLHYYLADVPEEFDELNALFANPLIPSLIQKFIKDERITISQIGKDLDTYPGTIQYHVKKMKNLDIVKSKKTEKGKFHLANIPLLKKYNKIFKEPDFSDLLRGI